MDGIISPLVVDQLIGAAGAAQWWRLVGAILLAVIAVVRFVTRDRFAVVVGEWISAVSALVGGIAAALLAGTVWWHALIIGLLVSSSSRGFWDRIRSLLPKRPSAAPVAAFLLVLVLPMMTSCSNYTPPPDACRTEAAIVSALAVGITAAENQLDMDDPEVARAVNGARGANAGGAALVSVCEGLRDGAGWQHYLTAVLEAGLSVAAFFGGAGPEDVPAEPPLELTHGLRLVEEELEQLDGEVVLEARL
jgi:hypothetical protein